MRLAYDGFEAVEAAAAGKPDLILLDIGLPKMNGYEVCQCIRKQQPGERRKVIIAAAGWGQEDDRSRSGQAGFDHHFVKPVDIATLQELLATLKNGNRLTPRVDKIELALRLAQI